MDDARVFPVVPVSTGQLAELVRAEVASVERVEGGLTNTIHRVTLAKGDVLAVKHYVEHSAFSAELATLTLLHGTLPVPDVVHVDDRAPAIVYRWIDGVSFAECRKHEPPAAPASIAEPLGRLLAWLARTDATEVFDLAPLLARAEQQLGTGRPRERLGGPLADALRRAFDARAAELSWGAVCLAHGDLDGRNLIVQRAAGDRWRINGVIDWEATTTGSPLVDVGSFFRHADRFDETFRADFARGYREADGELPDDWFARARLLDALWLVDTLDEPRELPGVFAECRALLARLAADVTRA